MSETYSIEMEEKRALEIPKLGKMIQKEQKKLATFQAECERLDGERKTAMQKRTDQQTKIDELHEDLTNLAAGGFPERLFPHASSEIAETADNEEVGKPARKRRTVPASLDIIDGDSNGKA